MAAVINGLNLEQGLDKNKKTKYGHLYLSFSFMQEPECYIQGRDITHLIETEH